MLTTYYTNEIAQIMIEERIKEAALYRQLQEQNDYRQKKKLNISDLVKTIGHLKFRPLKMSS